MRNKVRIGIVVLTLIVMVSLLATGVHAYYDFGGETVTIWSWGHGHEARFDGDAYGLLKEAEEKFNAKIEFGSYGSHANEVQMARLLAGDSLNDIWLSQGRWFYDIVSQGVFYPVSDVVSASYYDDLPSFSSSTAQSFTYQGKYYGFGIDYTAIHALNFVVWNKDIFEREGLPDLHELYLADEWTWDRMTEIAVQATRDTTGDGSFDQWGIGGRMRPYRLAMSNDAPVVKTDEDGYVRFAADESSFVAAIQQLYDWRHVHNVTNWGRWQQFIDGDIAMSFMGLYLMNQIYDNMEDDYGVVPFPKGPDATAYRYPSEALMTWVLPANSSHPDGKIQLIDFLFPDEEYDFQVEDYMRGRVRDRDSYQVIIRGHEDWSGEVFNLQMRLWGPLNPAFNRAIQGEVAAQTAMSEIQPEMQSLLDELLRQ